MATAFIPFAVTIEGVTKPGMALWVIALSGNRVLVPVEGGRLEWYSIEKCRFAKLCNPEVQQIAVLPNTDIVVPGPGWQGGK